MFYVFRIGEQPITHSPVYKTADYAQAKAWAERTVKAFHALDGRKQDFTIYEIESVWTTQTLEDLRKAGKL